tara:strand:+ start:291 stop:713 length:423 start_codon:yes stop_codon:yes gene_type:complete
MSTITKTETETWCENCEKCETLMGGKVFTDENEFDECPDRDPGYDEDGDWYCSKCRSETDTEDDDDDKERVCEDCYRHFIEDEDNYKEGWVSTKCFEGEGCRTDWDYVCCVGCDEEVCNFGEEPPHKDKRGEAVCEDCYK